VGLGVAEGSGSSQGEGGSGVGGGSGEGDGSGVGEDRSVVDESGVRGAGASVASSLGDDGWPGDASDPPPHAATENPSTRQRRVSAARRPRRLPGWPMPR